MVYLLTKITDYCLKVAHDLGKFFLSLDHNADMSFIKMQQCIIGRLAREYALPHDQTILLLLKIGL